MNDAILTREERVVFALRELYRGYGYQPYRMSKFEEYELYVRNKEFMVGDRVIAFNDTNGKMLALKPDVTLSIIKGGEDKPGEKQKVYYDENVYRVSRSTHRFKEIRQAGLECIGEVDLYDVYEAITLAAKSLCAIGGEYQLTVSHLGLLFGELSRVSDDPAFLSEASACISEKNAHDLKLVCDRFGVKNGDYDSLVRLLSANFAPSDVPAFLSTCPTATDEIGRLSALLAASPYADRIRFDFSLTGDANYYNGFIFKGFLRGIASDVLSGGQYDRMMEKLGRTSRAVGFALYLDLLEALDRPDDGYDVDVLLLYDGTCDPAEVLRQVELLRKTEGSCTAQHAIPEKLRYRKLIDLRKEGTKC
ncbi:MAG: ATP phosphoribosyltransferase regulatory subunit [Clostridia bacterium]|nr:ATP phosphoribosyltransferase regulatory subunit [Clostridia bacterium]